MTSSSSTKTPSPPASPSPAAEGAKFYCGKTFQTASQCTHECPTQTDGQCGEKETCFKDVVCLKPVVPPSAGDGDSGSGSSSSSTSSSGNGNESSSGGNSTSILEIVGIIVGVIASLITVEEAIRRMWRRKRRARPSEDDARQGQQGVMPDDFGDDDVFSRPSV